MKLSHNKFILKCRVFIYSTFLFLSMLNINKIIINMVAITKFGNSVSIVVDGIETIHPSGTLCTHINAFSDSIEIRYKASRKNAYSFNYKDLTSPVAADNVEAQRLIATILE